MDSTLTDCLKKGAINLGGGNGTNHGDIYPSKRRAFRETFAKTEGWAACSITKTLGRNAGMYQISWQPSNICQAKMNVNVQCALEIYVNMRKRKEIYDRARECECEMSSRASIHLSYSIICVYIILI